MVAQNPAIELSCRESPQFKFDGTEPHIMNAVMTSEKGNPLFKRAIDIMLRTKEDGAQPGLWGPWALFMANPKNFTVVDEKCTSASPCSCGVPGIFKSHSPCRY